MNSSSRIPRTFRLLLRLLLPVSMREYFLGDLEESYALSQGPAKQAGRRHRWLREVAGTLVLRFGRRPHLNLQPGEYEGKGDGMFREFWNDLRFGLRMMLRNPGFATVAILTLALGIGATTAIFSVVNGVLLTVAPYPEPERIVRVLECNLPRGFELFTVSPMNYGDWKAHSESFELMTAFTTEQTTFTGGEFTENLSVYTVLEDYLEVFGVGIALGRGFTSEEFDPDADRVAILRHDFWQRAFSSDPDIIGDSIVLDGESHSVIGVTDRTWQSLNDVDLILPLRPEPWWEVSRGSHWLISMARLKPGVTAEQARTELSSIATALAAEYPDTNTDWDVVVTPLAETLSGNLRPQLLILLAAVGLLLLIACTNVANMMLARAMVREHEVVIRMAVGAGQGRMIRQLLAESVLLSFLGGALGIGLALLGIEVFRDWPGLLRPIQDIGLDPSVILFTAGVTLITGILFGLIPALNSARSDLHTTLRQSGGSNTGVAAQRWRHGLVVVEVALAVILLVGSGLLLRSLHLLQQVDPGFERHDRLMLTTSLTDTRYGPDEQKRLFSETILSRLQALPGVTACALSSMIPLTDDDNLGSVTFEGRPEPAPGEGVISLCYWVSDDYFQTMGIPLMAGRTFTSRDGPETAPVVVISESLVRNYYPDENPIGRRVRLRGTWHEIIGVAGEVQHYSLGQFKEAQVYRLYRQNPVISMTFVLYTSVPPLTLAQAARREIIAVDPDQPVRGIQSVEQMVTGSISRPRFRTLLLACFAGTALLLAIVGLYGVMSFAVSQRTHEIGVRMALGAQPGSVLGLILRNGLTLVIIGIGIGLVGALALTRLLESLLFGVGARDPGIFIVVPLILIATALLAALAPARRATRVDPIQALVRE
ncbi:ABC transporter permease [Gemmatimonadota bacterium]